MSTPEAGPFCKTTWSKVEAGDVVLMALGPNIVEVKVESLENGPAFDDETVIYVEFDALNPHGFSPDQTVYIQQR